MQSNVDNNTIKQLVTESQKDLVQKLVVGAVIRKDNKFLLLERLPSDFMGGLVELPSGTVDAGEDLLTALAREVQEETGLVVTSVLAYLARLITRPAPARRRGSLTFSSKLLRAKSSWNPPNTRRITLLRRPMKHSTHLTSRTQPRRLFKPRRGSDRPFGKTTAPEDKFLKRKSLGLFLCLSSAASPASGQGVSSP